MPNHVYNRLYFPELEDKQKEILEAIVSNRNGLCGYYRPMPEDIRKTTSPTKVVSQREYNKIMKKNATITDEEDPLSIMREYPITKKMQDQFMQKYGGDNWYEWAYNNWGTKWGCYDSEIDGNTLRFTTAWSLFDISVLDELAVDFPNFTLHFEEEQGWGGTVEYVGGEFISMEEYDAPEWHHTDINTDDGDITELLADIPESDYREGGEAGYYYDYDLNERVPEEVLKKHKLIK